MVFSLLALVLAAPAPAPGSLELRWEAPVPPCPSAEAVREEVVRLVGAQPAVPCSGGSCGLLVQAAASEAENGWKVRVQVRWGERAQERTLRVATCAEASQVTALITSTLLDAERSVAETASSPTAPPATTLPPVEEWHLVVQAGLGVDLGTLPQPAALVTAQGRWERGRLGLGAAVLVSSTAMARGTKDGAGGNLQLLAGGLEASVLAGTAGNTGFRLAGRVEAGAMTGRGFGYDVNQSAAEPWVAALVGAAARWQPGRFGVEASVWAGAPLATPAFAVNGELLHRPQPAFLRGAVRASFTP